MTWLELIAQEKTELINGFICAPYRLPRSGC